MRRALTILAVAILPLLASASALGAGVHSVHHHTSFVNLGPFDMWTNNGNNPSFELHAHADNGVITVSNCCFQDWDVVNQANRTINGTSYPTWQIELNNTAYCVDFHADLLYWLNSCNSSNNDQRFAFNALGNGNNQIINVSCSNDNGVFTYLTSEGNSNGVEVNCQAKGIAADQDWGFFDS